MTVGADYITFEDFGLEGIPPAAIAGADGKQSTFSWPVVKLEHYHVALTAVCAPLHALVAIQDSPTPSKPHIAVWVSARYGESVERAV